MNDSLNTLLNDFQKLGLDNKPISREHARLILTDSSMELLPLLHAAGNVRKHYHANKVSIHVLDNVQNGACPEDCGYCGQSKDSDAPIQPYKIKSVQAILDDAANAKEQGAYRFCMALSGRGPDERDIEHMCEAIAGVKAMGLRTCLSAGLLDTQKAQQLKNAGLDRLNHNLNTSDTHYNEICTTHTYQQRMETLSAAREAGLGVCSGMIVGMNEKTEDLLDVAYALKGIEAESIPVNFLLPIEGNRVNTPLHNNQEMTPEFVLRVLCMFRLTNPAAEIRIAAGREHHLRSLQGLSLYPANSLFMEGYLLTQGQEAVDTIQMIIDAGFQPDLDGRDWPEQLKDLAEGKLPSKPFGQSASLTLGGKTTLKPAIARS